MQVDLVVCGAHLVGMAPQLATDERDALKLSVTTTLNNYCLYPMSGGPP